MYKRYTHWLLYAVFCMLLVAYYIQYRVLTIDEAMSAADKQQVYDSRWWILFVSRELKTLMVGSVLLISTARGTKLRKIAIAFVLFQSFELVAEVFSVGQRGNLYESAWLMILGLLVVLLPFNKKTL